MGSPIGGWWQLLDDRHLQAAVGVQAPHKVWGASGLIDTPLARGEVPFVAVLSVLSVLVVVCPGIVGA